MLSRFLLRRQRSEQYFTFSQSSSHFLRHVNVRLHTGHVFSGRFCGLLMPEVKPLTEHSVAGHLSSYWQQCAMRDVPTLRQILRPRHPQLYCQNGLHLSTDPSFQWPQIGASRGRLCAFLTAAIAVRGGTGNGTHRLAGCTFSRPVCHTGAIAQLVERCNRTAEVRGSNPRSSTRPVRSSPGDRGGAFCWRCNTRLFAN